MANVASTNIVEKYSAQRHRRIVNDVNEIDENEEALDWIKEDNIEKQDSVFSSAYKLEPWPVKLVTNIGLTVKYLCHVLSNQVANVVTPTQKKVRTK